MRPEVMWALGWALVVGLAAIPIVWVLIKWWGNRP